jgi:hypothetical protein
MCARGHRRATNEQFAHESRRGVLLHAQTVMANERKLRSGSHPALSVPATPRSS